MLDLILLNAAEIALQEIYDYLEDLGTGKGDRFLNALEAAFTQIRTFRGAAARSINAIAGC